MRIVIETDEDSKDACESCRFLKTGRRTKHGEIVEPFHFVCHAFEVRLKHSNDKVERCDECKAAEEYVARCDECRSDAAELAEMESF